jgi:hypothetical protein
MTCGVIFPALPKQAEVPRTWHQSDASKPGGTSNFGKIRDVKAVDTLL